MRWTKRTRRRSLHRSAIARRRWWLYALGLCVMAAGLLACAPAAPAPVATSALPALPSASPQPTRLASVPSPLPTPTAAPTATATLVPPPTPPCVQPVLTLGAAKFRIVTLARAADGSLDVPADKPDTGYWVEGTTRHFVFALSPSAGSLALGTALRKGDAAKIQWGDCSSDEFVVSALSGDKPDLTTLFDQSASGLSVVVFAGAQSLVITAGRAQPQAAATPEPTEANALQAELSFLGQQTTADGKSLVLSIALKNTGPAPLAVANKDISLGVENSAPIAPISVAPSLPQTVAPGATLTLQLTFAKPDGHTAVFRLLSFSTDIYY